MEDETDEKTQKQAIRRQKDQAIKAAIAWEKPKEEPREREESSDDEKLSNKERPK